MGVASLTQPQIARLADDVRDKILANADRIGASRGPLHIVVHKKGAGFHIQLKLDF